MYSDFVGVTYNKTHAKYQACITHYRKQHYLGRYKLAVDAARAYDQSAKLLKGDGWKINFKTDEDYEVAKAKEIEMIERRRQEAEMKNGGTSVATVNTRSNFDSTSRMVKEKLGLRVPLSQDPSVVAEKMLKDRLSAVAKQAADHADQLKMNGMDYSKKKNVPTTSLKKDETTKTEVSSKHSLDIFFILQYIVFVSNCMYPTYSFIRKSDSQAAKSAVTPSPHQSQNTNKAQSMLLSEALMSPAFMGSNSPTVDSLLAQQSPPVQQSQIATDANTSTSPSRSNAMTPMLPPVAREVKPSNAKQESSPEKVAKTSGNIFSSPNLAMKTDCLPSSHEEKEENKKEKEDETSSSTKVEDAQGNSSETNDQDQTGKDKKSKGGSGGALAAASALLSITRM